MLRKSKTKNVKKIYRPLSKLVKFCPICGSTDIYWASGLPHLWSIWECKKCGYRGALILEGSKVHKNLKKHKKTN